MKELSSGTLVYNFGSDEREESLAIAFLKIIACVGLNSFREELHISFFSVEEVERLSLCMTDLLSRIRAEVSEP